jgi:hypothetical protein
MWPGSALTPNNPHPRLRLHRHPHCVRRCLPLRHLLLDRFEREHRQPARGPESSESGHSGRILLMINGTLRVAWTLPDT